ncbi:MAG: PHP domain-containing protein [Alistipes finegoldii]
MIRADLHIHSQYSSDGEFRPADIVGKCAAGGVDLFALTDHNTVRGLDEACDGALHAGLEFVPGIEINCRLRGYGPASAGLWHRLEVSRFPCAGRDRRRQGHGVVRRDGREAPSAGLRRR